MVAMECPLIGPHNVQPAYLVPITGGERERAHWCPSCQTRFGLDDRGEPFVQSALDAL